MENRVQVCCLDAVLMLCTVDLSPLYDSLDTFFCPFQIVYKPKFPLLQPQFFASFAFPFTEAFWNPCSEMAYTWPT